MANLTKCLVIITFIFYILLFFTVSAADATDRTWRYDHHGRQNFMMIQKGMLPDGIPPHENTDIFIIKAPFKLESGFSFEATFTNPPRNSPGGEIGLRSGNCHLSNAFDTGDTFPLICGSGGGDAGGIVEEGATLTYVITK